jgi:hypothetical protein
MNFIEDNFSAFLEWMLFIPSNFQIQPVFRIRSVDDVIEAAILVFVLVLPMGVIFLCARWMKKYNLGLPASVLLAFLILSLALGMIGLILSIPRLSYSISDTFPIICVGSPVFNLVLSVIIALGHRLRNHRPIAGALLLFVAGLLFAYVFFTTVTVFLWHLMVT